MIIYVIIHYMFVNIYESLVLLTKRVQWGQQAANLEA